MNRKFFRQSPLTGRKTLYSKDNRVSIPWTNTIGTAFAGQNAGTTDLFAGGPFSIQTWVEMLSAETIAEIIRMGSSARLNTSGYLAWLALDIETRVDVQRNNLILALNQPTTISQSNCPSYWIENRAMDNQTDTTLNFGDMPSRPASADKNGVYHYKMFWRNKLPAGRKGFAYAQNGSPPSRYRIDAGGVIPYTAEEYVVQQNNLRTNALFHSTSGLNCQSEQFMTALGFPPENMIRFPQFVTVVPGINPSDPPVRYHISHVLRMKGVFVIENKTY